MKNKKPRANLKTAAHLPRQWPLAALLLMLTLAAYWNSFDVPLVFDDQSTIEKNAGVRFGEFNWNLFSGRAVLYLLFTLNYVWAGQEVFSYHVINFALHLLNGLLVFLVARRTFEHLGLQFSEIHTAAVLAAGLFLLHPIQTESVTYISSRSELLSTCFYLLGLLLFIFWPQPRIGFLFSLVVMVPFILGVGSKETVVTLPAAILLYDFLFLSGARFRPILDRWRFYATFIVSGSAIIYYFLTGPLRQSIGSGVPGNLPAVRYFLTELRVLVQYIRLLFVPAGLNLDYDFPPSTGVDPAVAAAFVFLGATVALGWSLRRRQPVLSFSIFWFFLTLAPTSSIVSILDVIFEHRLYLPLAGVCLSFPILIRMIASKLAGRPSLNGAPTMVAFVLLSALAVGTALRNHVWRDEVRLFTDVVAKSPNKERPYNSLAYAHFKRGNNSAAIEVLKRAIEMVPGKETDFSETLANVYLRSGNIDEAIGIFQETTRELEGTRAAIAYNNLGGAWLYKWNALQARSQQMTESDFAVANEAVLAPASAAFEKALEIAPEMSSALDSYITAMTARGKGAELTSRAAAILQSKDDFSSFYILGKVALLNGDWAGASQYFERAEKLRSGFKMLHFNRGYALAAMMQDDAAIRQYLEAIRIDPIFYEAHNNVALSYMKKREFSYAAEHFREVLRFEPAHFSANLGLAKVYKERGDREEAGRYLRAAIQTAPGNAEAIALMKDLGL